MYRIGRACPTHWEPSGRGGHCAERVEWLSDRGEVLSTSDHEDRARYLAHVGRHRAPCIAAHWAFLLQPLVPDQSDEPGILRYRKIEYQRMPVLAFLALDGASRLARSDFVRLGLVTHPGEPDVLTYSEAFLRDFEQRHCYDRYWDETARTCDRLVVAMTRMENGDVESVRAFKRTIRHLKEIFLRFTHRYWFHEISDQSLACDLYRLWARQLGTDVLYDEVRNAILDMTDYLDSDQGRRQAETVVRLTVVTVLGLIVNVVTGWFGMNLLAEADEPLRVKIFYFFLIFIPSVALILCTVYKSKRLSCFLEAMADDRLPARGKLRAFLAVWPRRREAAPDKRGLSEQP